MRTLVTGGAGFIGSHLVRRLLSDGHEVVVLDDLTSGRRENLLGLPVQLVLASVEDRGALREAIEGAEAVFHLAALVSVPMSLKRPATSLHTNVVGTAAVLEEARDAKVRSFVFASSAAVYGEAEGAAQREDAATRPTTPYGVSKLAGELLCAIFDSPVLRTVALRLFNVYGSRSDPHSSYASAVPALAGRARRGEPMTIFGDGEQVRDFLHVSDAVDAALFAATNESLRGVYNLGTGVGASVNEVARTIADLLGIPLAIDRGPARAGDVRGSTAAVDRIGAAGWTARTGLRDGLSETVHSY